MSRNMNEQFEMLGPDATLADLVAIAASHLELNEFDGLDFDIHGEAQDGSKVILHFECRIEKIGSA